MTLGDLRRLGRAWPPPQTRPPRRGALLRPLVRDRSATRPRDPGLTGGVAMHPRTGASRPWADVATLPPPHGRVAPLPLAHRQGPNPSTRSALRAQGGRRWDSARHERRRGLSTSLFPTLRSRPPQNETPLLNRRVNPSSSAPDRQSAKRCRLITFSTLRFRGR